jgi:hypothetical protein
LLEYGVAVHGPPSVCERSRRRLWLSGKPLASAAGGNRLTQAKRADLPLRE